MERTLELAELWDRVMSRRRAILGLVLAVTVVAAIIASLLPPWYRAEASLLPPSEETSFGIGNLLKDIGVPGIKVPAQAVPADVFLAILESRRVNEEIVRRFDLMNIYRKQLMVDALKVLKGYTRFRVDDVGIIRIAVEDRDPRRAAEMANAYFEELDRFNRDVRMTKGRRTRAFVEVRLAEARDQLKAAEQQLAEYQATHKAIVLSPEISSAIETAARQYANRAALQVRLGVIRSYTRNVTDEERQILQQLEQIDRQLSILPRTELALVRMLRDVKMYEQVFFLLTSQYEEARITEARDISTVEQLDIATPPERKSRPSRVVMTGLAFLFSLTAGVAYALMRPQPPPRDERPIPA